MGAEWEAQIDGAFHDLIRQVVTANYQSGPLYYMVLFVAAAYVCLEGYRVYRVALSAIAFYFGFTRVTELLAFLKLTEKFGTEQLLMIEAGAGLILAFVAWKIFLVGVFAAGYQLGMQILPQYFDNSVWKPILSTVAAGITGFLCMKSTRMVIVTLTAVIGGFTMVTAFIGMLNNFPATYNIRIPPANSPIWLAGKILLSIAGANIQGKSAPRGADD